MLDARQRKNIMRDLFPASLDIAIQLQGIEYTEEMIAYEMLKKNTKSILSDTEYDSFITPYLNQLLKTVGLMGDDEWGSVQASISNLKQCEDCDEDTAAYFDTMLRENRNVQDALYRQAQRLKRRLSADVCF